MGASKSTKVKATTSTKSPSKAMKSAKPNKKAAKKTTSTAKINNTKSAAALLESTVKRIFTEAGFSYIESDGTHFFVNARQGEIDHIFVYENLLVLCEETTTSDKVSHHFNQKKAFAEIIDENRKDFFTAYSEANPAFAQFLQESDYEEAEFEIRFLYFSVVKDVDAGLRANSAPLKVLTRPEMTYFKALTKTIGRSAKFELLKYLDVSLSNLGEHRLSGKQQGPVDPFDAFVLSARQTNYPTGFGVVSFYADPNSLIRRAYVMRRDGWEQPEISYQRFLKATKLSQMRAHLASDAKVYINNLIVSLPPNTEIQDLEKNPIALEKIDKIADVRIIIPDELGTVGIIDGQHRIFSYHEGSDQHEAKINKLRSRQNLLVTGLIFPKNYAPLDKVKFEAELFLKINDTQTKVRSDLRQEIETIVYPYSTLAISKSVIAKLARSGPLSSHLQQNLNDSPDKIKTSSLVRYVVAPLLNTSSKDSLYSVWLEEKDITATETAAFRDAYVEFCTEQINALLLGALHNLTKAKWTVKTKGGSGILTPTSIGGFLMCLRELIIEDFDVLNIDFKAQFSGLDEFNFSGYRSSRWAQLGKDLVNTYFTA